jgi:Ca-activated chloride channel family protein
MKMNLDDPKLTAYALDELSDPEKSAVEAAIAESPEARARVDELRELSTLLKSEYDAERKTHKVHDRNMIPFLEPEGLWTPSRRLALAAALTIFAVIGAIAVGTYKLGGAPGQGHGWALGKNSSKVSGRIVALPAKDNKPFADIEIVGEQPQSEPSAPVPMVVAQTPTESKHRLTARYKTFGAGTDLTAAAGGHYQRQTVFSRDREISDGDSKDEFNTATYDHIAENPFLDAKENPLSTFSIDVDTASYSNIRRFINDGSLPPKDAVRVEEMINYFSYDYPQPEGDKPFSINLEAASCPWQPAHRLVRIGLKGREIAADKRGASNLVFLLDVSGSMEPADRLPLVKQAMRLLVEKLTENDRVAIVIYAGASGLALPSTTGDQKERILSALANLQAGGSTNGAEGIELAYKIAADNFIKGGVNRVILATDGDFNVGVTSQGDLIRLIEEKAKTGVFLSVLGVGTDNLKDSTMQKLADKGNGNYAYLDSLNEARKVLVQQMNGTLVTIAKDVKVQVEFNPAQVASYRLIGYEKRMLRKEDFNNDKIDAGEIGAGHTVTALYEVTPVGASANPAASVPPVDPLKYSPNEKSTSQSPEMLTVKLRYKKPDGDKSELIERSLVENGSKFENASRDLKFAAAVAEFGMLLRDSEHKGNGTLAAVLEWAQEGKGADPNGYRSAFIELVRKAQSLKRG